MFKMELRHIILGLIAFEMPGRPFGLWRVP